MPDVLTAASRRGLLLIAVLTAVTLGPLAGIAVAGGSSGGSGLGGGPATSTTTTAPASASTTSGTLTTATTSTAATPPPATIPVPARNPFARRGLWIWQISQTDGGNVSQIITQARALGVGTLYVKSGDGASMWSQFSPALVAELHSAGFQVCAWQFIYGVHPLGEAKVAARAVHNGADCLAIDAETQYQGRYAQAQMYVGQLRVRVGSAFPLALAGFPYVDYHPGFPYSVFLGPNGAQYNTPQMYWQDIGTTVAAAYAHTYAFNEPYERPIFPLGQIYDSPPAKSIGLFRSDSIAYGAGGVSWWDWQDAGRAQMAAIATPVATNPKFVADTTAATVGLGAQGDLVVWAQEHLWNTHERVAIDGDFGPDTADAVAQFQQIHGLPVTSVIDPQTWNALLAVPLPRIQWRQRGRHTTVTASAARAGAALSLAEPRSAGLKERADELGGEPGMGRQPR